MVKEKPGDYYLREKEVIEDWTLPLYIEEMGANEKQDKCNVYKDIPFDTLYLLEHETHGFFELPLYAFLRN